MKNRLFFFQTKKKGNFVKEFFDEIDLKEKKNYFDIDYDKILKSKIENYKKLIINIILKEINFYREEKFNFSELEFFISHWAKRYIYISINRYLNLKKLKEKYINYEFNYLIDENNIISEDSFDFIYKSDSCLFNNSFCSKLSSHLNIKTKNYYIKNSIKFKRKKNVFKNILIALFFYIQKFKKKNIIFNTYLPKLIEYKLFFDRKFIFLPSFNFLIIENKENIFHRTKLIQKYKNFQDKDKLLCFIISNLFEFIPYSFFEYIQIYKNKSKLLFNRSNFKNIITGNHFDHNELFKIFCIYQKRNFSNITFIQHGNNYFTDFYTKNSSELIFSDKFLKWGSEGPNSIDFNFNIKTFNKKLKKNKNNNALFIFEDLPHKCFLNNTYLSYLKNVCMTKDFIDQFIFKNIRFKIKLINNSRNIKLFNSLGLNNTKLLEKGSFLKIINNYDLIIFNYYSTGFLECLSLNKPALVINNESKKTFNYKFINDLKLLQIHGLYFNNINSFNEKFNYDIQSFISYWHYPKTQIIINKFKKKYSNYENDRKILYRLII